MLRCSKQKKGEIPMPVQQTTWSVRSTSNIKSPPLILTLLATALLSSAASAQSGPRDVTAIAAPLSNAITYSETGTTTKPVKPPLNSLIGVLVTITNNQSNTLNKVRAELVASAYTKSDPSTTLTLEFAPSEGSPCALDAASNKVVCSVGQIQAASPSATFVLFYKAPFKPSPYVDGEFKLNGTVFFAEGTTDNPDAPNSSTTIQTALIGLGTSNPVLVKSGVRKDGGSIFTGSAGVPTDSLGFQNAALLAVPALPPVNNKPSYYGFSKLEITPPSADPTKPAQDRCPNNSTCLSLFDVTVTDKDPATYPDFTTFKFSPSTVTDPTVVYLLITLRRDATLFKGSINNASVYYYYTTTGWRSIPPCAQVPNPISVSEPRCVYSRKVLKNSDPEVKANPAALGDAQIQILGDSNGRIAW